MTDEEYMRQTEYDALVRGTEYTDLDAEAINRIKILLDLKLEDIEVEECQKIEAQLQDLQEHIEKMGYRLCEDDGSEISLEDLHVLRNG